MNKELLKRYLKYNFGMKEINTIYNELLLNNGKVSINDMRLKIESIIVKKLKEDKNVKELIKNDYRYIKSQIVKNNKYQSDSYVIDNIYNEAIDLLNVAYDNTLYLSINILNNMKEIYNNRYNSYETTKKGEIDISYLYDYIMLNFENKNEEIEMLSLIMDCNEDRVYDLIIGRQYATKYEVLSLCNYFSADNENDLEKVIRSIVKSKIDTKYNEIKSKNNEITKENINKSIDSLLEKDLVNILNVHKMNYKDALISIIMFGDVLDKSVEELSDELSIDKEDIKNVCKTNNALINRKLIYKNQE